MRLPLCRSAVGRLLPMIALALLLVPLVGCEYNTYELELKPGQTGLERRLTCWRVSATNKITSMPEGELRTIASLYQAEAQAPFNRKHEFSAEFADLMPQDVGGAGYFRCNRTPWGDEYAYHERFRGSLDVVALLDRRQAAADELTDHVIGWFELELRDEPGFDRLREFLDQEFRQDAKNLGLQIWMAGLSSNDAAMSVTQYLVERGYGSSTEIHSFLVNNSQSSAQFEQLVQRFVARKMGLADGSPVPPALQFLSSGERAQQSMERYLRGTAEYAALRQQWEQERQTNPDLPEPNPGDVLGKVLGRAIFGEPLFRAADKLNVVLKTGEKPIHTNGQWRESERQVDWSGQITGSEAPSVFCFAEWSEPNRPAQRERFGRVLLEGEELAKYALWYNLLSDEHRQEWDRFIGTLKPGLGLAERIGGFRFASDPPDEGSDPPPPSAADIARDLLLKQLLPR